MVHCGASVSELLVHRWCYTRQFGNYVCTACLQCIYHLQTLCATNDRVSFLPKVYTKLCIGSLGRAPSTALKLSGSIKSSLQSNTRVEKV